MVKSTNKYLVLDTNILVDCCLLQRIDNNAENVLKDILDLLNKGEITFLLPEIVRLEFEKVLEIRTTELSDYVESFKTNSIKGLPSEYMLEQIKVHIDKLLADRKTNKKKCEEIIDLIFKHKNTKDIKITSKTVMDAVKNYFIDKRIEEECKSKQQNVSSVQNKSDKPLQNKPNKYVLSFDKLIIESLRNRKELKKGNVYNLFLCTANPSDFLSQNPSGALDFQGIKYEIPMSINRAFFNQISVCFDLRKFLNEKFGKNYPASVVPLQKTIVESPTTSLSPSSSPEITVTETVEIQDSANIKGKDNLGTSI